MNRIFFALIAIAFVFAAWAHLTWRPPEREAGAAVAALTDGRAMVVGASGATVFDGSAWFEAQAPATVRRDHGLAPQPGGGALLVGGRATSRTWGAYLRGLVGQELLEPTNAAEVWDARRNQWSPANPAPLALVAPMVTRLPDGSAVFLGGEANGAASAAVLRYVHQAGLWERLDDMPEARIGAEAIALPDGDLLVVGGITGGGSVAREALRYDLATLRWSRVAGPRMGRIGHELALTPDGEVIVVGGEVPSVGLVRTVERYVEGDNAWPVLGQLTVGRYAPAVSVLPDGRIVVSGGGDPDGTPLHSAEVLRPGGGFEATPPLRHGRVGATGLILAGKAMAVGGGLGASFYKAEDNAWSFAEPLSPMARVGDEMLKRAEKAVMLVIQLIGGMTLFLGAMKVAEAGGLLTILARLIRPIMVFLFPDVPPDHPAMGAMILNMAANALGLGNAATPFGIRAMEALDSLNPYKGTASNAMALFLAINTSNVTILPTGVIVLRAINGSANPGGILVTTLFATICSTTVAIVATKTYQRFTPTAAETSAKAGELPGADEPEVEQAAHLEDGVDDADATSGGHALPDSASEAYPWWVSAIAIAAILSVVPLAVIPATRPWVEASIPWIIPGIIMLLLSFGFFRGVPVYESFVGGAKDGWNVGVRIVPFLVGIFVAIAMLQASGAMGAFTGLVGPWTAPFGMPADALPMALLRPLSGSGAMGLMISTISDPAIGPDSYTGYLVSTFQGSTETTFYVIAVYFGAVGIKRLRHSMAAALTADVAGVIGAIIICSLLYGAA